MKRPDGYPPPLPRVANRFEWIIEEARRQRQAARQRAKAGPAVSAAVRPGDRRS